MSDIPALAKEHHTLGAVLPYKVVGKKHFYLDKKLTDVAFSNYQTDEQFLDVLLAQCKLMAFELSFAYHATMAIAYCDLEKGWAATIARAPRSRR